MRAFMHRQGGYLLGFVLFVSLSLYGIACSEPTEVAIHVPQDTLYHFDTTVVHDTTLIPVHDTTIVVVTDTLITIQYDTTLVSVFDTIWCQRKHGPWVCMDVQPVED